MAYSTMYLYDIQPQVLATMLYPDALKHKLTAAHALIGKLIEPHYSMRDDERITAVQRAVKFNQSLLEELK